MAERIIAAVTCGLWPTVVGKLTETSADDWRVSLMVFAFGALLGAVVIYGLAALDRRNE